MTSALLLREARKRAGLTQRQLAERLGVAQPQVARWESGRAAPSFERLKAVLAVCGLDVEISLAPRDEDTVDNARKLNTFDGEKWTPENGG